MLRLLLVLLLAFVLSACTLPDGHRYGMVTEEFVAGVYLAGAYDYCMEQGKSMLIERGIPLTAMNQVALHEDCDAQSYQVFSERVLGLQGDALPERIPRPNLTPPKVRGL